MPGANDPDKELKACLDRLPYPKWIRAHKLINATDQAPAKPTYLNFNALGAKIKTWCMNGEAKHVLKMAAIFRSFNQDPVPFLDWEQLLSCMRRLVALDKLLVLKDLCALFKTNGQNPRQLPPGARWSLLTFAAFLGRAEIVDYLTGKEGCFPAKLIDEVDEQGCTALTWAAASGSVDAVRTLIDRNADVNPVISTKESPLMIATCKGHAHVVRLLIDREADVNMVDGNPDRHGSGWGPVQKACWWGHDDVLGELLLEYRHNPALEKTLRASATLQGHDHILELLDGKRGPRSCSRVIVKLYLGIVAGNERDLRREVRTVLANALKPHSIQFSDVAVPDISETTGGSKAKIAHCEIRIRYSTVVAVWRDLKLLIEESGSPIRKSQKLQVDPAQSEVTISYPVHRMTQTMSGQMTEAIKKHQELNPVIRGKKDPLAALDLDTAPSEFVRTAVDSVQEAVLRYEEVAQKLNEVDPQGMAKLRDLASTGRHFIEAPYVKEGKDEEEEDEEDPEDGIFPELAEKEDEIRQMLSQLMPFDEARAKNLIEDIVEHYQTTDVQKRYEIQFEKIKETRKKDTKDIDAPTATLLAPTFSGAEKKPVKEEVEDSDPKDSKPTNNTLAQVKKGAILAQKKVKSLLVPGSEWAAASYNDTNAVPHGDPLREIYDQGLALGGHCIDPGIKDKYVLDEKAKALNPEEPNYLRIVDACRLGINFATADALLACVEALSTKIGPKADVCWIHNRFHTPSVLGYQDINIGIRITLPGEKSFFCEVLLSLDKMYGAKADVEPSLYKKMRSCLADLHIPETMHNALVRSINLEFEHVES